MNGVLAFLERNGVFLLLAGPKSIAVTVGQGQEESVPPLRERERNVSMHNMSSVHHKSASKLSEELNHSQGRRSLVVSGDYFRSG